MNAGILVGDIGGTSARFAIAAEDEQKKFTLRGFRKQSNEDFSSLSESLSHYLTEVDVRADAALMAVAGPIDQSGSARLINRDWPTVIPSKLGENCGIARVKLVNDFAAMSRAIPEVSEESFVEILSGESDPKAPVIVTGPGTGFGVGTLIPMPDGKFKVLTGEGGHTAYAASTVREAELAERLKAQYGYVSTEMIVSGAWLQPVFNVLSDMHGQATRKLTPAEIMDAAEAGDPVCFEVCKLRARSIMGAVGDAVLIAGARGGAVLTGGVAERMVKWLQAPDAVERFFQRGSHTTYMQGIPVRVMTEPKASLIGAAALTFDLEI